MNPTIEARWAAAWPPQKIERLRFLVEAGHSFGEIGEIMGIGKNAALGKAHRLKLKGPRMRGAWPEQKTAELTGMYVEEGLTMTEIGRRMGISKNAVVGKVTRLELVRGSGFVPSPQQASRLKAEELRGPASSTLYSRLDDLHTAFDAARVPDPPRLKSVKATDNATRPFERRRGA